MRFRWFRCFWIDGSVAVVVVLPSFLPCFFFWGKCVTEDKDWKKQVILLQYCKWNFGGIFEKNQEQGQKSFGTYPNKKNS